MKSDHRHELKTNELADWIAHFPEWIQENRTTLIGAGVVLVVIIGVYFVKFYRKDTALVRQQMRLTTYVTQLPGLTENAAAVLSQGQDESGTFTTIAETLENFAETAKTGQMAALALIKRAEALRAGLHYRPVAPSREDVIDQIAQAQTSYSDALERAGSTPALAAAAQFGLGLCQEELGNFDQAGDIYRQVANDTAYAGTTAQTAAAERLKMMSDYQTEVVFKPAPPMSAQPSVSLTPENLLPMVAQPGPNETSAVAPNTPTMDSAAGVALVEPQATEVNVPVSAVPEANTPVTN